MKEEARLVRKLRRDPAAILTDRDIAVFRASAEEAWKEAFALVQMESPNLYLGARFEDSIRWGSLGARCQQARDEAGLDLKAASSAVAIPRYRAEAIERGELGSFRPDLAWRYFEFLGISRWVRRWARANRELAIRAGFCPVPGENAAKRASIEAGNLTARSTRRTPVSRGLRSNPRATGRAR